LSDVVPIVDLRNLTNDTRVNKYDFTHTHT